MPQIQLTISVDEQGAISVNGPINDKILCYGLLGAAHDAIKEYHDKRNDPKIAIPQMDASALKRGILLNGRG